MDIIIKIILLNMLFCISCCVRAELTALKEEELVDITAQSGLTLNAKVVFGDETSFTFENEYQGTNTFIIVDEISGSLELKGLKLDLISDFDRSGKPALQWTLPDEIEAKEFKSGGIYASSTKEVTPTTSAFLVGVELDGALALPANTQISVFVVD